MSTSQLSASTLEAQVQSSITSEPAWNWLDQSEPSESLVHEWASQYRAHGLGIAVIRPGDKIPTYREWNLSSKESEDFGADDNIGILTGTLSGNLVCVDLDHRQAVELADQYLPATDMVEGRPGKPRSHRYYRVTEIGTELAANNSTSGAQLGGPQGRAYRLESGAAVVEILGTGRHVVAPPSLHPSGEVRSWDCWGQPAELPYHELIDAVERLATACGYTPRRSGSSRSRKLHVGQGGRRVYLPDLPPMEERVERARKYLQHVDPAVTGESGHKQTFYVACLLLRGFALDQENARELLEEYSERCDPPWTGPELEHKLASADQFEWPRGHKLVSLWEEPTNPHRLARAYLDQLASAGATLRYWRQELWKWNGTRYKQLPDDQFRADVCRLAREEMLMEYHKNTKRKQKKVKKKLFVTPVTTGMVTNTVAAIQSESCLAFDLPQPSWIESDDAGERREYIALTNGLLDVGSGTPGTLLPHDPRWFSPVCLPYTWDPSATCPQWIKAINLIFEGDQERIALLQEWFGYCLVPWTDLQKFMILVGEGGNGKNVILATLHGMLGHDNVSSISLEQFSERFLPSITLGKLANISTDMGELDKAAEGKLKMYTSGDPMSFDRKGREPMTAIPTARLTFATNNLPRFSDRSDGVFRRLIVVPCNYTIPADQRVLGMDKSSWWEKQGELPGILVWALEGLQRVRQNGAFTEPAVCKTALQEYRDDNNPARQFLLEVCFSDSSSATPCKSIYTSYATWCQEMGHKAVSNTTFGKEVKRAFPGVEKYKKGGKYSRENVYSGLATYSESGSYRVPTSGLGSASAEPIRVGRAA